MSRPRSVVFFFVFANERGVGGRFLRNLDQERRSVELALEGARRAGHCEILVEPDATVAEVFDVLQDPRYRDRVAVFHFGGHAGDAELLLETPAGDAAEPAHAGGLAAFLGEQRGLKLVFLNGCSTEGQVRGLLDAGVAAVIATSEAIDDAVASELSARFYRSLGGGASILTAYREAEAAARTRWGDEPRAAYRSFVPEVAEEDRWPWQLHVAGGARAQLEEWSLPRESRRELERIRRRRRIRLGLAAGAAAAVVAAAGAAWWQSGRAREADERARDRARGTVAADLLEDDSTRAHLVALELRRPDETPAAAALLHRVLAAPAATLLAGHTAAVTALAFSPDGSRVSSASADGTLRIWDALTGEAAKLLEIPAARVASFSPDGSRLLTASGAPDADASAFRAAGASGPLSPASALSMSQPVAGGEGWGEGGSTS